MTPEHPKHADIFVEDDRLDALPSSITNLEADTLQPSRCGPALAAASAQKPSLIGLDLPELQAALASVGMEPYRARQVWNWLYAKGAKNFDEMTNIAKSVRPTLEDNFSIARPEVARHLISKDGTQKWLLAFEDGNKIESVFIPDADRGSLCVSSQVGCTLSCSFCHTGTMKLVRNLSAGEIISQVMVCRDAVGEWGSSHRTQFTNIVMMGMGEPLYNYEQVSKALKIIMDPQGIAIAKRRITLSTSGVVPMIQKVGEELNVNLAISLHAVTDELRNELVPLNKKYPIAELMEACRNYPGASNMRRITFEYVMLKGVNDSDADARGLVQLLKGVHAKVNLIPFNPWQGSAYETSDSKRVQAFADIVHEGGYVTPIRRPRGRDIYAACGMLKSDSERKKGEKIWLGKKGDTP